eukprot:TRINITY_DN58352_c0_g1_i1.p2 TRINITY_DN58352_c0_g1~~TRINITY_DN58352_c0_g1_i1.p2  ORF type:complete len:239 (+),score=31.68 TRINITY_DN58352_c0_g1_i1:148-864(+)
MRPLALGMRLFQPSRPVFIQSTWGMSQALWDGRGGKKSMSELWAGRLNSRYWSDRYAAEVAPANFSPAGRAVIAELTADTRDLLTADWTLELDHHWIDQLARHRAAAACAGPGRLNRSLLGFFFASKPVSEEEHEAVQAALCRFEFVADWALRTEEIYSHIFETRFEFLRHHEGAKSPMEREQLLAANTVAVQKFLEDAPNEFKPKIQNNLEMHLFANRHWVWEVPNLKAAVAPDYMA